MDFLHKDKEQFLEAINFAEHRKMAHLTWKKMDM